jgi:hypothetical protein
VAVSTGAKSEGTKKNNSLRDFGGVNTQAARQVIGDNQFAWLENVQPIGFGNMPALPGPSASLATWSGTAYKIKSANVGGVDYELVFTTNGACYAVNLSTYAVTTVGAAATFGGSDTDLCQWQNSQVIIVDATKGYFSWDGATLTKWNGTVQSLVITAIGAGYTSAPALGFSGGGGAGAAGTIAIQVGLVTLTAGGATYNVGDLVTISGGTSTVPAVVRVATVAAGVITGINLVTPGVYTVAPANPAASTSPYGTGATFTLNFGIGPILTTTPGSGTAGGAVTAVLSVVPTGSYAVASYEGRIWCAINRTIVYSAPNSFSDFSTSAAGGSFIISDETMHSNVVALSTANNFLYILGTSSVNVLSDVAVVNGATVFSNTNLSASIGTSQEFSVIPYYRALWFANSYGIYALYGSTVQKASDDLDGVFPFILAPNEYSITAGAAVIRNILTLCFMFRYADPKLGSTRTLIACFAGKKWYFASQRDDLIYLDSVVKNGTPTAYATDGSRLYQMFANTSASVAQTIVTKLWDMGDPLSNKQPLKFGLEVINPSAPQTITGTIDTELSSGAVNFSLGYGNTVTWINSSGNVVQWQNTLGDIVDWVASGYSFLPLNVETTGRYIGATLNGTSAGTTYAGMHFQYEHRAQWPQGGAQ